jgi:ATP-dependent helicase/nuclease subunit B
MCSVYRNQFDRAVDRAISGAVVLTSNTRAARAVVAACDRRLSASAAAWGTPTVIPLSAWLQQVWREAQARGATEKVLLRPLQQLKLWEQIIARSAGAGELLRPVSVAPAAVEAYRLLHAYRIPQNSSSFAATVQTREFSGWCNSYQSLCRERGWTDDAVLADEVAALPGFIPALAPPRIAVWGFDEITPQQAHLFAALGEGGVECELIGLPGEENGAATRTELPDAEQELEAAAQWARAKLEADPGASVGIVVPGLAALRATAERVLLSELNPEFFAGSARERAFDISLGPKLDSYLVIRTAVLALRWVSEPLASSEVRELLLSPYVGGAGPEASPRAQLVVALSKRVSERVALPALVALLEDKDVASIACPQLKAMLRKLLAESGALATRGSWGTLDKNCLLSAGSAWLAG